MCPVSPPSPPLLSLEVREHLPRPSSYQINSQHRVNHYHDFKGLVIPIPTPPPAISRGCSKAPALARRGKYNRHQGAVCSQHVVNIMRATVCLCDRDTCNGPSLPPQEMIDDDEHVIDIDEVVREMNSEPKEPEPEPVSGSSGARSALGVLVGLGVMSVLGCGRVS